MIRKLFKRKKSNFMGPVFAVPEATISAKVYRAATGKWTDLGVISGPIKEDSKWLQYLHRLVKR